MSVPVPKLSGDPDILEQEIDDLLDTVIALAVAARRELRYGDDHEALRASLATMKMTTNEICLRFLKLPGAAK